MAVVIHKEKPKVRQEPYVTKLVRAHEKEFNKFTLMGVKEVTLEIGNTVEIGEADGEKVWTIFVRPSCPIIRSVTFERKKRKTIKQAPFEFTKSGVLESDIIVTVRIGDEEFTYVHTLNLTEGSSTEQFVELNTLDEEDLLRMSDTEPACMHGLYYTNLEEIPENTWFNPIQVVTCDEDARPGYDTVKAHEYQDDPRTLKEKIRIFAELIQSSENCMAYTGAGISTSSGIDDYASKAKNSKIHEGRKKTGSGLDATPSLGHRTLAKLFEEGFLKHWVQQNHDGLPQKAGMPQQHINEIHGAWYDPSNPVIPMSGTLRDDLSSWLEEWETKTDLTIAMGTSLCGMSADSAVEEPSMRYSEHGIGFGSVIVGLQRTTSDSISTLRIYAKIDEVAALLLRELGLSLPIFREYSPTFPENSVIEDNLYRIPYDKQGNLTEDPAEMIVWDLRVGAKIKVVSGPGEGFKGAIISAPHNHYSLRLPKMREGSPEHGKTSKCYRMGCWWAETATKGLWHQVPIVNRNPILQQEYDAERGS